MAAYSAGKPGQGLAWSMKVRTLLVMSGLWDLVAHIVCPEIHPSIGLVHDCQSLSLPQSCQSTVMRCALSDQKAKGTAWCAPLPTDYKAEVCCLRQLYSCPTNSHAS